MKLTLLSITFKGKRYSKFIMLPCDSKGKVIGNYDTFAIVKENEANNFLSR